MRDQVERSEEANTLVFSYLTLRKTIGILGILFPFVLALGAIIFFKTGLQGSVSAYFHTGMHDIFVPTLCVIAFFLFSYKGYVPQDDWVANLACIGALGVAFFPTAPPNATRDEILIMYFHWGFTLLFFGSLIYLSLALFTKSKKGQKPTPKKLQRNKVYRVCGVLMALCIVLIGVVGLFGDRMPSGLMDLMPIFWLEAVAIVAFGVSWLVKGEALLKDVNPVLAEPGGPSLG